MLDLTPATGMVTRVVADIDDDQLGAPTPCRGSTVADLLDHLDGFCLAFTAAAAKDLAAGSQGPSADGSRLGPGWGVGTFGRTGRGWHRTGGCAYPVASLSWPARGRTRRPGQA